jgi:hypothetical protein
VKQTKRSRSPEKAEKSDTVSFNGAVVGATPPAVPVKRVDGAGVVDVAAAVAVRLRDDADDVVRASVAGEDPIVWRLAGSETIMQTAQEVRAAAAEQAGLEVSVGKILADGDHADRRARVAVEGAGLVVQLTTEEASVLLDDAARRVLLQLKSAGVRGRVRVEFQIETEDGMTRDSRPGAVRKLARGEPVGASPERRERRRRSRSRGRRKPANGDGAGEQKADQGEPLDAAAETA